MVLTALIHFFFLSLVGLSLNINFWTSKLNEEGVNSPGKFLFIEDKDSSKIGLFKKLFVLLIAIIHISGTVWLSILFIFRINLFKKNMTEFQFKNIKKIKINRVSDVSLCSKKEDKPGVISNTEEDILRINQT